MAIDDLTDLIGKRLLVGITYIDSHDAIVDRIQFAGIVTAVEPLVTIDVGDCEPFPLPPEPEAFDRGEPGEYRLRGSGEIVVDPDFITTWSVEAPEEHPADGPGTPPHS